MTSATKHTLANGRYCAAICPKTGVRLRNATLEEREAYLNQPGLFLKPLRLGEVTIDDLSSVPAHTIPQYPRNGQPWH